MSAAIGGVGLDMTFTGAETQYSLPVNVAGRTPGDLHGVSTGDNCTVSREVSTGNELGPWIDGGDTPVVFADGVGNKLYPVGLATWERFKVVAAGACTFAGKFVTNPVAQ